MTKLSKYYVSSIILGLILLIGAGLRLYGVGFGLPYMLHPDEGFEIQRALQLGTGSFDFDRVGKGFYFYILFLEYGLYFLVSWLLGRISGPTDFAAEYVSDPSAFLLIGRVTSVILGCATIFLLYRLATRVNGVAAGLIAGFGLALSQLHVGQSQFVTVDVLLVFFCMITFVLIQRLDAHSSSRLYMLIGASIACASATKMPGVLLLVPFVLWHFLLSLRDGKGVIKSALDGRLIRSALIFVAVFVVSNPGAVVNGKDYLHMVTDIVFGTEAGKLAEFDNMAQSQTSSDVEGGHVSTPSEELAEGAYQSGPFHYYLSALLKDVSVPIMAFALIGLIVAIRERLWFHVNMALFAVLYYVLISSTSISFLVYSRYLLPIIPLVFLLAGFGIYAVANYIGKVNSRLKWGLIVIAVAWLVIINGVTTYQMSSKLSLPDTREVAAAWFEHNIPGGSSVMIEGYTARVDNLTVPLRMDKRQLTQVVKAFNAQHQPGKAMYFQLDRDYVKSVRYKMQFYNIRSVPYSVLDSDKKQADYFVVRPRAFERQHGSAVSEAFLSELDESRLWKEFKRITPEPGEVSGQTIVIYSYQNPENN